MRFSIISPSYNQAAYIARTIETVAKQNYADKEHIIVDGGSTDGSVEILREMAAARPHISAIVEPDNGQADAINKGFRAATGDILCWVNTDDYFLDDNVLSDVAEFFKQNPAADVVYGRGVRVDDSGKVIREAWINRNITGPASLRESLGVLQPSLFFRRSVFEKVGGLSEEYNLQLDYEYWIRMLIGGARFKFMDRLISGATVHVDAKSTKSRLLQLSECLSMLSDMYGEVPDVWFDRFARFQVTGRDEKTGSQSTLSPEEKERSEAVAQMTRQVLSASGPDTPRSGRRIIVTSFDSQYFDQGLNLIASLHRTSFYSYDEIVVYPLGLSAAEREMLVSLDRVRLLEFAEPPPPGFPDFFEPKGRAYKTSCISGVGLDLLPGDLVLWMDAGLSCCSDIAEVFDKLENEDWFICDHDDSRHWPFYNINFTHPAAVDVIAPTAEELLALHLCSCIVGHKRGGAFQHLIDEAYALGRNRAAIMWPKVLRADDKQKPAIPGGNMRNYRNSLVNGDGKISVPIEQLLRQFPYYGHRTQSIYSVLCYRYNAPVSSGRLFRRSNEESSQAATKNWTHSASDVSKSASRNALGGVTSETRIYHHRGVFSDLAGLKFKRSSEPAFIVGNGPSLRGFDFERLRGRVWVGMNAAYRYWDSIGIYPHLYVCFDTVVQDSHAPEIKRLIERREEYGIRWFFLRRSFLEFWPEAANLSCVLFLEDLQEDVSWFDRDKITTGSFSAYCCAFLGHTEIYVLGVDLNYVEQIPEASVEGRELVIKEQVANNPNYFFDGYQKPGDRYNPPNRHAGMHVRSWGAIPDAFADYPIRIVNCNPESAVRCFPFSTIDKVLKSIDSRQTAALRASELFDQMIARQDYFRSILLARLGVKEAAAHRKMDAPQITRFCNWLRSEWGLPSNASPLGWRQTAHIGVSDRLQDVSSVWMSELDNLRLAFDAFLSGVASRLEQAAQADLSNRRMLDELSAKLSNLHKAGEPNTAAANTPPQPSSGAVDGKPAAVKKDTTSESKVASVAAAPPRTVAGAENPKPVSAQEENVTPIRLNTVTKTAATNSAPLNEITHALFKNAIGHRLAVDSATSGIPSWFKFSADLVLPGPLSGAITETTPEMPFVLFGISCYYSTPGALHLRWGEGADTIERSLQLPVPRACKLDIECDGQQVKIWIDGFQQAVLPGRVRSGRYRLGFGYMKRGFSGHFRDASLRWRIAGRPEEGFLSMADMLRPADPQPMPKRSS